jgi:hypothetical protein
MAAHVEVIALVILRTGKASDEILLFQNQWAMPGFGKLQSGGETRRPSPDHHHL